MTGRRSVYSPSVFFIWSSSRGNTGEKVLSGLHLRPTGLHVWLGRPIAQISANNFIGLSNLSPQLQAHKHCMLSELPLTFGWLQSCLINFELDQFSLKQVFLVHTPFPAATKHLYTQFAAQHKQSHRQSFITAWIHTLITKWEKITFSLRPSLVSYSFSPTRLLRQQGQRLFKECL